MIENHIKRYMREGLADDKWIQLAPGTVKTHPWIGPKGNVSVALMTNDTAYHYDIDVTLLESVEQWAKEVAEEYGRQEKRFMLYQEYMTCKFEDQAAMHRKYYGQYIDDWFREQVVKNMGGIERLKRAYKLDTHFNRIPLYEWDGWCGILDNSTFRAALKERGDFYSISTVVCVVKEAARQAVEVALEQEKSNATS